MPTLTPDEKIRLLERRRLQLYLRFARAPRTSRAGRAERDDVSIAYYHVSAAIERLRKERHDG